MLLLLSSTNLKLDFPGGFSGKLIPLPMQETWVQFLSQEDPSEKKMTTHSSILAWEIPRTKEFVLIAWLATIHRVAKNNNNNDLKLRRKKKKESSKAVS